MKKFIILLFTACSLISLTACGKKDEKVEEQSQTSEVTTETSTPELQEPYPMATETPDDLPYNDEEQQHLAVANVYPSLDVDNVIFQSNQLELEELMKNGTGVVYFANPQDKWSQFLIYEVDLACKAVGMDVKLYDLTAHLENNDEFAQTVKTFLELAEKEEVEQPTVVFIKNGTLAGSYAPNIDKDSTSPEDYYDADKTIEVENKLYEAALNLTE